MEEQVDKSLKLKQLADRLRKDKEKALARRDRDKRTKQSANREARKRKAKERVAETNKSAEKVINGDHNNDLSNVASSEYGDNFIACAPHRKKMRISLKGSSWDNSVTVATDVHRNRLKTKCHQKAAPVADEQIQPKQRVTLGKRPNNKASCQKQKDKWKIYSQRYRDKKKSNVDLVEQEKTKEHERYLKRKQTGKIKLIKDVGERVKRKKRKQWRENTRRYRERKALSNRCEIYVNENSPPETPSNAEVELELPSADSNRQQSIKRGRHRVRKDRAQAYVRLKAMEEKLKVALRQAEKYKKRLQRIKKSNNGSPSPRTKVNNLLKGRKVGTEIRKKLEYGECLHKQLKHNARLTTNEKQKQIFTRAVTGPFIKKYRMLSKTKQICSWWRYNSVHNKQKGSVFDFYKRQKRRSSEHELVKKQVLEFLENDSNSRMCAGKKECVGKGEQKRQKRFLTDSMQNLHKKFCELHQSKLCYAKFCVLRPFWIVEPRAKDRETCLCVRHANMELLVQKLGHVGIEQVRTPADLVKLTVCDMKSKRCMYSECENCKSKAVLPTRTADLSSKVSYYRWVTKNEKRINGKNGTDITVKITVKEKVDATHEEMLDHLERAMPEYKQHCYRVYHQQAQFSEMKSVLRNNECILVMDFSENYACKYAAEAQSVHFGASRQQVTLHTAVLYYRCEPQNQTSADQISCTSFCTISSSLRHDPVAIWAHIKPVFSFIADKLNHIDTLNIWSDGPTTQYRNKKNFGIFSLLNSFGNFRSATWNFAESGHGKSAADGIGGSIKRMADGMVAHGCDITDANVLYSCLHGKSLTQIYLITEAEIVALDERFDMSQIRCVKGTMKLHQLTWSSAKSGMLGLRFLTCLLCPPWENCMHYDAGGFVKLLVREVSQTEDAHPAPLAQIALSSLAKDVLCDEIPCADERQIGPDKVKETALCVPVNPGSSDVSVEPSNQADALPHADDVPESITSSVGPQSYQSTGDESSDLTNIGVSTYVAAIYDDKWYPGVVLAVDGGALTGTATIKFMSRTGQYFIWPKSDYIETLPISELLCKVTGEPTAVSKTRYKLADSARIDDLMNDID